MNAQKSVDFSIIQHTEICELSDEIDYAIYRLRLCNREFWENIYVCVCLCVCVCVCKPVRLIRLSVCLSVCVWVIRFICLTKTASSNGMFTERDFSYKTTQSSFQVFFQMVSLVWLGYFEISRVNFIIMTINELIN